ncbi:MAG TPA: YCF48-related protein [Usitatibacter sp.]|nr:YCF48-related protein [Usitatibacter sp.]
MMKAIGAAALGCGILVFGALAAEPIVPESGPLSAQTVHRLLLVDAERVGNRIVAVGDRGYIVVSEDRGATWHRAKAPRTPMLTAIDFLDDKLGVAVGHDATILVTQDGGESWSLQFSAPKEERPLLDVRVVKKDFAVAVGAYGAYYESTDGGKTWTGRKITEDDKHFNSIVDLGEGRLMIFGEAGTVLASNDWGRAWTAQPSPYKGSFFGSLVAGDGALLIYGMRGHIYRSPDKGKTWSPVDNASSATLMGGDKLPDGSIVLAGSAGTALVSRDDGRSFQPVPTHYTRALSKPVAGPDGQILLLGEGGVLDVPLAAKQ